MNTVTSRGTSLRQFGPGYAAVYDSVMRDVPYESWAGYIEDLMSKHNVRGRRVLDLACGTGVLAMLLARRGFLVTAVDKSPSMLEQCRRKLAGQPCSRAIELIQESIAGFRTHSMFDCAICFFDSLNYILDYGELVRSLVNVSRRVRSGGLFAFDVNTGNAYRHGALSRKGRATDDAGIVAYSFAGRYDRRTRLASMAIEFAHTDRCRSTSGTEYHRQRAYRRQEVTRGLQAAGFEPIWQYKAFSLEPAVGTEDRVTYAAIRE